MGMFSAALRCRSQIHRPIIVDEQNDQRPSGPTELEKNAKAGDSSDPLFTMFSNSVKEGNKTLTKCWKDEADSIIFFVRPESTFMYWWGRINELNRLLYSLPSLLCSSLYHSKTSDQTPRIHPHSISRNFINFKPTQMCRAHPHHLPWPLLLHSLRRAMLSG